MTLGPTEYLRVANALTGELRNDYGPKLSMPSSPHEEVVARLTAIPLKRNQYIKLIDKKSGEIRVERGESSVYLSPTEEVLEDMREGVSLTPWWSRPFWRWWATTMCWSLRSCAMALCIPYALDPVPCPLSPLP